MPPSHLPALLLLLALAFGCREDLDVAPAYVTVDQLLIETPDLPGTTSAITEVWVFADNEFVGAFPLPATVPVFAAGETSLRFEAGVRRNGISATPEIYPFYAPVERTLELRPGETMAVGTLTTGYRTGAEFGFVEDFEPGDDPVFSTQLQGAGGFTGTREFVRSGEFSGRLMLSADDPLIELATEVSIAGFSTARPNMWLEVDFRSDVPVAWGVIGGSGGTAFQAFDPTFAPRDEWTKIYFDLSELVAASSLSELGIYLSAPLLTGQTEADVYLDNIRLLFQ